MTDIFALRLYTRVASRRCGRRVRELGPTTEDGRIRRKHAVTLLYSFGT